MSKIRELQKQGKKEELWQICCGFLDLSLEQFMAIQKQLLLEQIELLKRCELGRKVMHGTMPDTIEEFREQVPLTTYKDYCPELLEKREKGLPAKPVRWIHSSGRSGEYPFKWIPISQRIWDEMSSLTYGVSILASCKGRNDFPIILNPKLLYATAPAPYATGIMAAKLEEEFGFKYFPSPQEAEQLPFMERLDKGFWQALSDGVDGFFGLSIILVAIGEQFKQGAGTLKLSKLLLNPKAMLRLTKGLIKSKIAKHPMLPKDLWTLKGISSMGTDSMVYKEKIKEMWGVYPLDVYGSTEFLIVAVQTWDHDSMTFVPNLNLLEFIPEKEHFKWQFDHSYKPKTLLLDEVEVGENYELIITNFHGGAMVRYRTGDMVRITALQNKKLGINIPQMVFERRADDLIDLGPMRLTEKTIWQAIENTNIPYKDWTARKEIIDGTPVVHLYLELKDNYIASEKGIATAIYKELKKSYDGLSPKDLVNLERLIGFKPIDVTLLPEGAFANYMASRQAEGADLAHLKPPHINPPERMLSLLGVKFKGIPKVSAHAEVGVTASR